MGPTRELPSTASFCRGHRGRLAGPRLRRFGSAVAAVVPDRFPAYVRILHSARGPDARPVRWAEVAAWSGRTMHRLAQFHAISRPAASAPTGPPPWNGEDPPDGNLPAELLRILCGVLAEHTSTSQSCWFCLWDGYGWLYGSPSVGVMGRSGPIAVPPPFPAEVPVRCRQHPNSAGPTPTAPSSPSPQPGLAAGPRLVRGFRDRPVLHPGRRVGGPRPGLVGDPRLEAWRVQPADPIAFDSDQINT
jgi:hypothetical protein